MSIRSTREVICREKVYENWQKGYELVCEVVRCGCCEWWKCNPNTEEYGVCKKVSYDDFEVVMNSDDFCSYGERMASDGRTYIEEIDYMGDDRNL